MKLKTIVSFPLRQRPWLLVGLALLVAVAGAGLVGSAAAQTPTPAPAGKARQPLLNHDQLLSKLAGRLSIDVERLREAIVGSQKDLVQEAVQAGRLTQEQADEINRRIDAGGGQPFFGPGMHGKVAPRGRVAPQAGPRLSQDATLQAAATYLGVSLDDLQAALRQGKSLAQLADEKGKARTDLRAALVQDVQSRTAKAVQDGRITQEQADALQQQFSTQVDQLLDRTFPARPARPAGPGAGRPAGTGA